MEEILRTT